MKRIFSGLLCGCLALWSIGCAMPEHPYDDDYAAFGGRWERQDPAHGRVGSAFTPQAGMRVPIAGETDVTPTERDLYPEIERTTPPDSF